jgi:hypothetical protein
MIPTTQILRWLGVILLAVGMAYRAGGWRKWLAGAENTESVNFFVGAPRRRLQAKLRGAYCP